MSALSSNNPRPEPSPPRINTVEYLIVVGLGYCCEAYFWSLYLDLPAPLIAARLGCRADTIRRHKQWYTEERFTCTGTARCIPNRWRTK